SAAAHSVTLSGAGVTLAVDQVLAIGTTLAVSTGTLELNASGIIQGGTVIATGGQAVFNSGTLNGVTYQGTLDLSAGGANVFVENGITLEGPGGIGPGTVTLTGAGSALQVENAGILNNADITIGGPSGTTGALFSTLGNFDVSDNATLTLGTGLVVTIGTDAEFFTGFNSHDAIDSKTALGFTTVGDGGLIDGLGIFLNEGGISVGGGASLTIGDSIDPMTFSDKAGVTVSGGGQLVLGLSVTTTGAGTIGLDSGGLVELGSAYSQTVTFGSDGPAKLVIDNPASFTGTLATLSAGDTIDPSTTVTSAVLSATKLMLATSSGTFNYTVTNPGYTGTLILKPDPSGHGTDVIIPCFAAGTRVATPGGPVAVERLVIGDVVRTRSGMTRPVVWVGRRQIDCARYSDPALVRPIRVHANALGKGVPCRDLLLSPDHAVFVDGLLIPVRLLVNHSSIKVASDVAEVEYVHLELPTHDILLAEGLPAESYLDAGYGTALLPGRATRAPVFPGADAVREVRSCAPFATDASRVEPIWRRIAETAGEPARAASTTPDPDLRLLHRGRTLRPVIVAGGRHVFVVSGGGTARLVSRASRPSDTRPWLDDRRRLGVCVSRIIRDGAESVPLALDHPGLRAGWWERGAAESGRWTDGDAELPVPAETRLIEVTIRPLDHYRLDDRQAA
ncbi:MAG: Hint domain-containing protein, partial [Acetobacteraceae bacterium]